IELPWVTKHLPVACTTRLAGAVGCVAGSVEMGITRLDWRRTLRATSQSWAVGHIQVVQAFQRRPFLSLNVANVSTRQGIVAVRAAVAGDENAEDSQPPRGTFPSPRSKLAPTSVAGSPGGRWRCGCRWPGPGCPASPPRPGRKPLENRQRSSYQKSPSR